MRRNETEDRLLHFCADVPQFKLAMKYALDKGRMLRHLDLGDTPLHALLRNERTVPLLCAYIQVYIHVYRYTNLPICPLDCCVFCIALMHVSC